MIISRCADGKHMFVSWREGKEKITKIIPFEHYFFIKDSAKEIKSYSPSRMIVRDYRYEEGDWQDLNGNKLKKVIIDKATDIYSARKNFAITYEADVPYHFRFAVDELTEIPEYEMRKWYWDMEWQQGGEHHDKITTIVTYDNYDERYYQWVWFPNDKPLNTVFDTGVRYIFGSEKDMLEDFVKTMVDKDPDMLIAWFGHFADVPKLISRCCALGINPNLISPIGNIKGVKPTKDGYDYTIGDRGYSSIEQPIGGRITLNLDVAFERQWNDAQKGTLPSLSLDYVSEILLGEKKLVSEKFPDPNEFYRRGWLEDTETYLDYALKDVELTVKIDESNYCSEAILALQKLLIAPFDACFYASHMGSIYFMRNAWWKAPTGDKSSERKEYQGAMIYDPLSEDTNGLWLNVAAFDFAGLYPSMMVARNISFETKSKEPTEFAVNLNVPRHLGKDTGEKDMRYFKTDELGLLPKTILELKELRNEYKRLMKEARNKGQDSEYVKWYNNQMAVKRLSASMYGILAFQGFGWSDVELAASITASAREAIRLAAFKAKELEV